MKPLETKIKKDELVLFSTGKYSDYNVRGLAKALQDIDPEQVRNDYINIHPEQTADYSFDDVMFIDYLKELKLIEFIEAPKWKEWYLEAYSCISHMFVYNGPILFT